MSQLGIFVKNWQPGNVKTRLAATIGEVAASEVYRQFVVTMLRRFASTADQRVVAYTPADCRNEIMTAAGPKWTAETQVGGDLGERMRHFFESSLARGTNRVVLIGSDSPTLPSRFVSRAFELLQSHDVALGPSTDGGYYLIGVARVVPPIFAKIPWSAADVWQQTIDRLHENNCSYATLPEWYDVDDIVDLRRLRNELAETQHNDRCMSELLSKVERSLNGATT